MIGAVFAVLSAASFGLVGPFTRRGLMSGSATQAVYVTVIMGVPLLFVATIVTRQIFQASSITPQNYLLLAVAGIVHYIWGRYCGARSFRALGVNRATPIQALATIISVLAAVILLGEKFTAALALGVALVMIGPTILIERPGNFQSTLRNLTKHIKSSPMERSGSRGNSNLDSMRPLELCQPDRQNIHSPQRIQLAEGYFFGILASLAWGISPIIVRFVLSDTSLSILACTISYVGAASVLILSFMLPGRVTNLQKLNGTAVKWFLLAGTGACIAHMFWFVALGIIPVTIAAPLQYTSPIFSYLVSFLLNRNVESFGPRIVLAIGLSVAGSMILGLSYA